MQANTIKLLVIFPCALILAGCSNNNKHNFNQADSNSRYSYTSPKIKSAFDKNGNFQLDSRFTYTKRQILNNGSGWIQATGRDGRLDGPAFKQAHPTQADLNPKADPIFINQVPQNVSALTEGNYFETATIDIYDQMTIKNDKYDTHAYGEVNALNGTLDLTVVTAKNNGAKKTQQIISQGESNFVKVGQDKYKLKQVPFISMRIFHNIFASLGQKTAKVALNGDTISVSYKPTFKDKMENAAQFVPEAHFKDEEVEREKPNTRLDSLSANGKFSWNSRCITSASMTYKTSNQYVTDYCKVKLNNVTTGYGHN